MHGCITPGPTANSQHAYGRVIQSWLHRAVSLALQRRSPHCEHRTVLFCLFCTQELAKRGTQLNVRMTAVDVILRMGDTPQLRELKFENIVGVSLLISSGFMFQIVRIRATHEEVKRKI